MMSLKNAKSLNTMTIPATTTVITATGIGTGREIITIATAKKTEKMIATGTEITIADVVADKFHNIANITQGRPAALYQRDVCPCFYF